YPTLKGPPFRPFAVEGFFVSPASRTIPVKRDRRHKGLDSTAGARVGLAVHVILTEVHMLRDFLFLILFFLLLGVWATAWLAFHVAGGLIHLLLILAVVSLIMHL